MDKSALGAIIGQSIKLYALMTPPAVLSAFINGTQAYGRKQKIQTACKTSLAIFLLGTFLFLFGQNLFALFGFTLDAFRIGVGLLLFLSAITLMNDDGSPVEHEHDGDISVVPLAIPLGMGPSAIGAVMVIGASATTLHDRLSGVFCLLLASLSMFLLLLLADKVARALGRTGIIVMAKLTALLLSAMAAQVIFTGVAAFLK